MERHNENHTGRLKRKMFDTRSSEFNSSKQCVNKVVDGHKFGDEEVDGDYAWFLNLLSETNEQTKYVEEEVIEDDKDPQYVVFLKQLIGNGKSYKLKLYRSDEAPCFLEYHEQDKSNGHDPPSYIDIIDIGISNSRDGLNSSEDTRAVQVNQKVEHLLDKRSLHVKNRKDSMMNEVSRKKKIEEQKSVTEPQHDIPVDACYQLFLDGCINSEYGSFVYQGNRVKYEEEVTSSDSDVLIWDNVQGCSEVNNNQLVNAKKDPSLREKLMHILRQPYSQEEFEELSEYVEQEKPICRLLPLRHRAISSALDGSTKSMLADVPASFRIKLEAARNDRSKALSLLRGFRFWLEHLPNEGAFKPWLDNDCLKVIPSSHVR